MRTEVKTLKARIEALQQDAQELADIIALEDGDNSVVIDKLNDCINDLGSAADNLEDEEEEADEDEQPELDLDKEAAKTDYEKEQG